MTMVQDLTIDKPDMDRWNNMARGLMEERYQMISEEMQHLLNSIEDATFRNKISTYIRTLEGENVELRRKGAREGASATCFKSMGFHYRGSVG